LVRRLALLPAAAWLLLRMKIRYKVRLWALLLVLLVVASGLR
jgi:hypothetical protein